VRQLQVLVDDETREDVAALFDDEGVDYVRQEAWSHGDRAWLFSAPVPDDATGYFIDRLSEATDMSQDPTSFLSMIFLSSVIAAAGLLVGSPAVVVVGSFLLLVVTMVLINFGAFGVLLAMGYRPDESGWLFGSASRRQKAVVVSTAVALLLVVGIVSTGTVAQIAFDREISDEVNALTTSPEYRSLDPVTIRTEYTGELLFPQPETVTVRFAYSGSGQPPDVVDTLVARIRNATDQRVTVRTVYTEYDSSAVLATNATNTTGPNRTAPNTTNTTAPNGTNTTVNESTPSGRFGAASSTS